MALTLKKIIESVENTYRIKLVAGKTGENNIVTWIHILEDADADKFVKGNEIVFTTGITISQTPGGVLDYVKRLKQSEVSGVVFNIGHYIKEVDEEVITYCNDNNLPLYVCPWEIRLVEVTKILCEKIIADQTRENSFASDVKDFIFLPNKRDEIKPILERYGLTDNDRYCVAAIGYRDTKLQSAASDKRFEYYIRRELEQSSVRHILFWHKGELFIIFIEIDNEKIAEIVEKIFKGQSGKKNFAVGVGNNERAMENIAESFDVASKILCFCLKLNKDCLKYDELGIYKVILAVNNKKFLVDYSESIIGELKKHDQQNNTDLYDFLLTYIENNCSVAETADALYIHRNTVNYKIGKIKKITGRSLTDMDSLMEIMFALCIDRIR